jgi:multiple sugar transport system ATP-binding protein
VILGARPEYVTIEPDGPGTLPGAVSIVENLGASALVTVEVTPSGDDPDGADPILVQAMVAEGSEPAPGQRVSVACQRDRALLYDAESGDLLEGEAPAGHPGAGDRATSASGQGR